VAEEAAALRRDGAPASNARLAEIGPGARLRPSRSIATAWNSSSAPSINMQFPGYFLIVADFIQWAKAQGIPVGPGRGSGAGSLVAYALTITDLDPLRFGLLFERFLNPERVSMPDFDIDFCQDRREEVITYVQQKYGREQVAQIITFGKLQARAALRDVGRVLQLPLGQVDRICKMVPNNPANPVTLKQAIAEEPRLQAEREQDEGVGAHDGRRPQARGAVPPRLDACRRHRHRRPPAGPVGAALPRSALDMPVDASST
jgi:DNA polymerase-3 subunit alpha